MHGFFTSMPTPSIVVKKAVVVPSESHSIDFGTTERIGEQQVRVKGQPVSVCFTGAETQADATDREFAVKYLQSKILNRGLKPESLVKIIRKSSKRGSGEG